MDFDYAALSKAPDPEGEGIPAGDAADRLIVDLAAATIRKSSTGTVVTVGDRYGALTLASMSLGARGVRVCQDSITSQIALDSNADRLFLEAPKTELRESRGGTGPTFHFVELGPSAFSEAKVVLLRLPRDLAVLAQWVRLIAAHAAPDVRVFAGGRIKHMTTSMNEVISEAFERVDVSLARQKARVLIASQPRADLWVGFGDEGPTVDEAYDDDLGLWVCSSAGVFAPGRVDIGTRFLLPFLVDESNLRADGDISQALLAADLGSGTGILGAALLKEHPEYRLVASDRSRAAVRSTEATLRKNLGDDRRFEVVLDHGLSKQKDSSLDLVICNPPFHSDTAVAESIAVPLFRDAARALKPGGVMLTVFNSHLPHRRALGRIVGPTTQLGRNPKFTVTKSVKRTR